MKTDKNGKTYTEEEALDVIPTGKNCCAFSQNFRNVMAAPWGSGNSGTKLKCNFCPFWEQLEEKKAKCWYLNIEDTSDTDKLWDAIKHSDCPKE